VRGSGKISQVDHRCKRSHDWYIPQNFHLSVLSTSWKRRTCRNFSNLSVPTWLSACATQVKQIGIVFFYLPCADVLLSHDLFILDKRTNVVMW